MTTNIADLNIQSEKFAQRVSANQAKLTSEVKLHYDFIVCGSGSSGSVVARRLAEKPCVIIGERAAEIIRNQHQIEPLSFPLHGRNRTRHDKGAGKAW